MVVCCDNGAMVVAMVVYGGDNDPTNTNTTKTNTTITTTNTITTTKTKTNTNTNTAVVNLVEDCKHVELGLGLRVRVVCAVVTVCYVLQVVRVGV